MALNIWTLLLIFCAFVGNFVAAKNLVVCYYGTWATYRTTLGRFDVSDVNVDLCTHVIYTFVGIDANGTAHSLDPYLDLDSGRDNLRQFNALKQKNPKLKTILAVGGWNEGSRNYSIMVAEPALRQNFINTSLTLILDYGFDGYDLDWEYPNQRDTVHGEADVDNFTQLIKELREAFDKYGLSLSAAVSAGQETSDESYDIPGISKYLDFIHVMTYDFYVGTESETGYNAALYGTNSEDLSSVAASIEYWIESGCPPEKILLGLPFYGHTFTLANASDSLVGAPSTGAGIAGPYTITNGTVGYNEFCVILQNETWDVRRDEIARIPYAVQDLNWVSYDDPQSLTEKVKYAKKLGLGGIMIWSIETDDFHGLCGEKYGLLKAINRAFGNEIKPDPPVTTESPVEETDVPSTPAVDIPDEVSTETKSESTSKSTSKSTSESSSESSSESTSESSSESTSEQASLETDIVTPNHETTEAQICQEEGITFNPKDCSSFIMCVGGFNGQFEIYVFQCPKNLQWDIKAKTCNYPEYVHCAV